MDEKFRAVIDIHTYLPNSRSPSGPKQKNIFKEQGERGEIQKQAEHFNINSI